jgi:hydroxymethylpyrimidine pyrophosphatase-like HAD family hydrolase
LFIFNKNQHNLDKKRMPFLKKFIGATPEWVDELPSVAAAAAEESAVKEIAASPPSSAPSAPRSPATTSVFKTLASSMSAATAVNAAARSANANVSSHHGASNTPHRRRILLLTDLDGTLVDKKGAYNAQELQAFNQYWNEHERPKGSILVYNTARCIAMYTSLVERNKHLLPPDVLITGEGAEIRWKVNDERMQSHYGHDGCRFVEDAEWKQRIRTHWWDGGLRQRVRDLFDVHDQHKIAHLNDLTNAPPCGEARHAITVESGSGKDLAIEFHEILGDQVDLISMEGWIEGTELVTASPSIAGKDGAAQYVAKKLLFADSDCLAAGDTQGDASMLKTKIAFVCVGNGTTALKHSFAQRDSIRGDFMSEFGGAGGVLDGLLSFVARST